jgi:hypothetical protein
MRLEQLIPEKLIWSLGVFALLLASALFCYELMRPQVLVHADKVQAAALAAEAAKKSPFVEAASERSSVLVKLPELPLKYQQKVFYVWQPSWRRNAWISH